MYPRGQTVKLSDSYFIPFLGFGSAETKEVTEVIWGWGINSSGCNMSRRDLGCQALGSWVTLEGSHGSTNQARTMPCERGESTQSSLCIRVWGCAHRRLPWVPLQFPPLFQLGRRGETWLSRSLTVNCFALRAFAMARFLCMFYSRTLLPSKKAWPREVFEVESPKDEVNRN